MTVISRLMMAIYQQGFRFETQLGQNVKTILVTELGLEPEFVDKRVATVFINGKAVDDLESAQLTDGCVLSLSGAMPGLVGACLRKSGRYASFRSGISYLPENQYLSTKRGVITVKLFNALITELGPIFLQHGILIDKIQYQNLIAATDRPRPESSLLDCIKFEETDLELYRVGIA